MAVTFFPRWRVILTGVCCFLLSCLLLLAVSTVTSNTGLSHEPVDVSPRPQPTSAVARPLPRRLAQRADVVSSRNESRFVYTPLAAPTAVATPTDNRVKMGRRYVMSLTYWEELTMATNSWMQLALLAKYWGAYSVRPFTINSNLYGLPREGRYPVDIIYDPKELDRKLAEYLMPPIASFEEFISKAGRNVVLVRVDYRKPKLHMEKCKGNADSVFASAFTLLNHESRKRGHQPFRLYNCCIVHGQHPTHPDDIAKGCGLDQLAAYTVITPEWRGITHVLTYRLLTPAISDINHPNYDYDIYPHSKEVIGNATAFINEATNGEDFMAIHYRLESFVIRHDQQKTDGCLDLVPRETRRLQGLYPFLKHLLIFGDEEISQARDSGTFKMEEKVSHFPLGKYGSILDRGFVAQVEQNVMSRARVLITAGCGSFQAETVSRFHQEARHIKRYHVCNCE